jgi:predicted Zn-dependent protease
MLLSRHDGDPNLQEAIRLATAAVQNQPRQAPSHDTLAYLYGKSGDAKAASAELRKAVMLDPDNAKWHIRLAQSLLDAGNVVDAAKAVAAIDARQLKLNNLPSGMPQQLDAIRKQIKGNRT